MTSLQLTAQASVEEDRFTNLDKIENENIFNINGLLYVCLNENRISRPTHSSLHTLRICVGKYTSHKPRKTNVLIYMCTLTYKKCVFDILIALLSSKYVHALFMRRRTHTPTLLKCE